MSIDRVTHGKKIAIAGSAECSGIEVWMLVQDVVSDTDVRSHRQVQSHAGGQNADVFVRIIAFENMPADRLAQAHSAACSFADDVVDLARFAPQAKFAAADIAGHAF